MVRALGNFFTKIAKRWIADAFVFAIVLTIIVFGLGMIIQKTSFLNMASYWGGGMWSLLGFSMQMVLVLVTGSALAISKPVHKAMVSIAKAANTPAKAIIIVTVVALLGNWLNWGFGLIVSAILAKEIAKANKGIHYPLLVASAYSGSIPLSIAAKTAVMEKFAKGAIVPTSETIFSVQTLAIVIVLFISIPVINMLMHPRKKEDIVEVNPLAFQLFTYYAAGIVNMFVPSGGGQWAVQCPIMMPAAEALGVSYGRAAMGIAWGDAWTNMIQPFWALPLLAVAKLNIKDIMGYTTVILLWAGIVTSLGMLFL
jgi:short subunit fatty acids transporter